jgi:Uma2 family endonuclease
MSPTTLERESFRSIEGEDDSLYEVVNGSRVEKNPIGAFESLIASILSFYLGPFALEHKLGIVATETLFELNPDGPLQLRPDVAFVSYARWPEASVARSPAWRVVPDLAVEIISPSNLASEVENKIVEYFEAGVRLVGVFHPDSGRVYVHKSLRDCQVLERTDELSGDDVVPGFRLPIEQIYAALTRP